MDDEDKPRNFRAFKRALHRRVDREIAKKTKLEKIASVLHKRYSESDSSVNSDDDRNSESVNGDNNVHFIDRENDEDDYNESDDLENDDVLGHDLNNSELSTENSCENSSVHDSDNNNHSRNESHVEEENSQGSVSSDETDLEEEQLQCAHVNVLGQYVARMLSEWAREKGILSMRKLESLLARLHPAFPSLCLTYKTLLKTPINIELIQVNGGELWYKGIIFNLDFMNLNDYLERFNEIVVDINIDGLPISKSSRNKFWPILGRLVWSKNEPFIISIFKGNVDPDIQDFLYPLVREIRHLLENGYTRNGIQYKFSIRHYILDAPARAKVKCCRDHAGYCACEKCEVIGEYIDNRMISVELNESLRTDESYNNQKQPYHHTGHSPLEEIGAGLVSQFRLDGMHLIFLGVMKRLLLAWKMYNGPWKLHRNIISAISNKLILLRPSCPQDFNRPPRPLIELSFYKATEFRRFLLYDGILVLRDYLNENIYKHFLLLHCGIYILSSPVLVKSYCRYAGQLLRTFIKHAIAIYGAKFVVYNVHSMCHLEEECEQHGHLDNFSAFVFENKLQSIKMSLHSGYKPLQQAAYRDLEKGSEDVILENRENRVVLSMRRSHPVNEVIDGSQYKRIIVNNVIFQCNNKDSCFKTVEGEIAILLNIVHRQGQVYFVAFSFSQVGNVYEYPLSSAELGIVKVSHLSKEKQVFLLVNIAAKCWLMPNGDSFVCVPLLHTIPLFK